MCTFDERKGELEVKRRCRWLRRRCNMNGCHPSNQQTHPITALQRGLQKGSTKLHRLHHALTRTETNLYASSTKTKVTRNIAAVMMNEAFLTNVHSGRPFLLPLTPPSSLIVAMVVCCFGVRAGYFQKGALGLSLLYPTSSEVEVGT